MMSNQYGLRPFRLTPVFVPRVWGKTDLTPWFQESGTQEKVGEAWLTGPECLVDGGDEHGRTLRDLVAQCGGSLGDGEFPLLVKILFPSEKLSVQVHPNDKEAIALGLARGKTECWYVLDAQPGATVACGLREGVSLDDVSKAAADGTLEDLLTMLPVKTGDMVFVEAGTVHAIGPGVTLLEVQQTSDITYRLYDYGRPRDLHLEEGLKVVKTKTEAGQVESITVHEFTRLIKQKYFILDRFDLPPNTVIELPMDGVGCVVGLKGKAAVNEVRFGPAQAVIVPVGSVTVSSAEGASFVRCWLPEDC